MRKKTIKNAKLVVRVISNKKTKEITLLNIFDNRTQNFWAEERIQERGVKSFIDLNDLKETLNWNLDGDSSKYQFKWEQSNKETSTGTAYIFD